MFDAVNNSGLKQQRRIVKFVNLFAPMNKRKSLLLFTFLLTLQSVSGQGFRINNQGVKASGMGGYACAVARDASAAFYNPAAISRLETSQITAGVGIVFPRISYLDPYSGNVDMDPSISLPFHVYGVTKLKGKFTAGIALYTPFSENTSWDESWSGKYISVNYRFRSLNIQPVISYAFNDVFAFGAGPVLSWMGMKREFAIDVASSSASYGMAEQKSASSSFGYTAALHAKFSKVALGLTYRSKIKHSPDKGEVTYSNISSGADILENITSSSSFSSEITEPASLDAGLAWDIKPSLQLTINGSYTMWSALENFNTTFGTDRDELQLLNYEDALSFSAGGNYKYTEKMTFRAGIGFTKSHVADGYLSPAHPDADQFIYSGGITYTLKKNINLDLSLMVRDYKSRNESENINYNFKGDYKSTLYITGIGINYEF